MRYRTRRSSRHWIFRWRGDLLYLLARIWRLFLFRTTFIGITGSVGKTTAKECVATILSSKFSLIKTRNNQNDWMGVPATILRVRPWHRFAVIEIGTDRPGLIRRNTKLVRPQIAIVLAVAGTHTDIFADLDQTASEKAQILDQLPKSGIAILNGEDPRVAKMGERRSCTVKLFGLNPSCDLWATQITSRWPSRLSFFVNYKHQNVPVKTSLVGEHWVNSVLSALLTAISCGIDLKEAAAQVERVNPFMARMQPVRLPTGATILRDEQNGSFDTLAVAMKVLKESEASRKILVVGDVSDTNQKARIRFRNLGRIAAETVDLAIFIGEHGYRAVNAACASGMTPDSALNFLELQKACLYLKSELRKGDLVLLRGRATEHVTRIYFGLMGNIGCWKTKCDKTIVCDLCSELKPEFELAALRNQI